MSENKRFTVVMNEFDEVEYITDIVDYEDRDFADFIDFANEMAKENDELKQENIHLEDDLRYYKTKSASCEQGLIQYEDELNTYKRKVEETLQKYYTTIKTSEVLLTSEKNDLRRLLDTIADDLGVDLE